MKFLVTGLPRMRSAWLAALFSSDRVRCIHELSMHGVDAVKAEAGCVGVFDPAAPMLYPDVALELFERIVIIERDPQQSRVAFERWLGCPIPRWDGAIAALAAFTERCSAFRVRYEELDDYGVVAAIHEYCTNLPLCRNRFELFKLLKIEQHRDKAERFYEQSLPHLVQHVREMRN